MRLGVHDIEDWARKVVRDYLPDEHRAFHTALPFLVVAARDALGRPWATLLSGPEGFVTSPDPRSLVIEAKPVRGDALEDTIESGGRYRYSWDRIRYKTAQPCERPHCRAPLRCSHL